MIFLLPLLYANPKDVLRGSPEIHWYFRQADKLTHFEKTCDELF